MAVKSYTCDACGAAMVFDPVSQKIICPHCGTAKEIESVGRPVKENELTMDAVENLSDAKSGLAVFTCQSCGARLERSATDTSAVCPYCDSSMVKTMDASDTAVPDGMIPFGIDKKGANERLRRWAGKRWFAPKALKDVYYTDHLTGLYLPFYTFDAFAESHYTAQGGRNHTVTRTRNGKRETHTEIRWYNTGGHVTSKIDDVIINAGTGGLDTSLLGSTMQFDTVTGVMPYSPDYMAGFAAQVYSLPLREAVGQATSMMHQIMENECSQDVLRRYQHVRFMNAKTTLSNRTYKYILAPIWSASYHYKDKNYQVLINGQTGEVKGRYPKSAAKIAAVVAAVLVALAAVFWYSEGGSYGAVNKAELAVNEGASTEIIITQEESQWDFLTNLPM